MSTPAPEQPDFRVEFMQCLTEPLCLLSLRRIFVRFLQFHFSDPANHDAYLRKRLGCHVWSETPTANSISISLGDTDKLTDGDTLPDIKLSFSPLMFTKFANDNLVANSEDNSRISYSLWATTELTVAHFATHPDVALAMGESTANILFGFRKPLMARLGLSSMELASVTSPVRTKAAPEPEFKVDTKAALQFQYGMTTAEESHRLKEFAIQYQAGLASLTQ